MRPAILALLLLCSMSAWEDGLAGENVFNCRVVEIYEVAADGKLTPRTHPFWKPNRTATFVVDRFTGAVVGEHVSSRHATTNIRVTNAGTKDQRGDRNHWETYWLVVGSATTHLNYVRINEWKEMELKPMTARVGSVIYSGLCE